MVDGAIIPDNTDTFCVMSVQDLSVKKATVKFDLKLCVNDINVQ